MGYNIAKHLVKHVEQLNIVTRNSKKTLSFISKFKKNRKVKIFNSLEDLTKNSNIIISCVGNDKDLRDIFLSKNGILNHISKNTFIRDADIKYKISKLDMKSIERKVGSDKKTKLGEKLIVEGREYLLTLIEENPLIIESDENILLLDSIRVLLRYRNSTKNDNQIHFAVGKLNINEI